MKKVIKSRLFIVILTMIICISGTLYAANVYYANEVKYTPTDSSWNVTNVNEALNSLYSKTRNGGPTMVSAKEGETHKGIVYLDPTHLKNGCDISNSISIPGVKVGCMKWYIYDDSGDSYKLILDHNTTETVIWNKSGKNSDGIKEAATALASDTTSWDTTLKINNVRLITADEIAKITGNTAFDSATTPYTNCFYFDSNKNAQTATSQGASKYAWLFDYTTTCTSYGCNIVDPGNYGYWTSTPIYQYGGTAWAIDRIGGLFGYRIDLDNHYGIRPVITISKSIIK